jgi:DNA-binding transcriptional ArsR family regulator
MVEYAYSLDNVFSSLADPTRRDILRRIAAREMSVSEIARPYDLTLAAISKHLKILEKAQLIIKRKRGKQHIVHIAPQAFSDVEEYLRFYRDLWEARMDSLENVLNEEDDYGKRD